MNKTLLHHLAEAEAAVRQAFEKHIGLSRSRYTLLSLLAHGETSHAALQRQLKLDNALVTRLVKQFEADGLVQRRSDPADNRFTLASLTPTGQRVVAQIEAAHHAFIRDVLTDIPIEEQERASAVLARLVDNLQKHADEQAANRLPDTSEEKHDD